MRIRYLFWSRKVFYNVNRSIDLFIIGINILISYFVSCSVVINSVYFVEFWEGWGKILVVLLFYGDSSLYNIDSVSIWLLVDR